MSSHRAVVKSVAHHNVRISRALVLLTSLLGAIDFAIVMPSVWGYLVDELHITNSFWLGATIAVFSLARTLGFPIIGAWSDHRNFREPFLVCCFLGVCGGCMYGMAGRVSGGCIALALAGRAVGGIGAACSTLAPAYISKTVHAP